MSRRAAVLMLAAVIAVAVAIPALADSGTTAKTASVKGLSTRALAKAKDSLRLARAAKREVRKTANAASAAQSAAAAAQKSVDTLRGATGNALQQASLAGEKASGAQRTAAEAQATVAATAPQVGTAAGSVATESLGFVPLANGPAVTLTVPTSGLVQVWAQALIDGPGAVSLYQEGKQVEGQAADCNGAEGVLFAAESAPGEPLLAATPAAFDVSGSCATLGAPGPVLFQTSAGVHSFELRYATCTCGGPVEPASFSERRLIVAPLP